MDNDIHFHAFAVSDGRFQAEFLTAATIYVQRWQRKPLTVWLHPSAPELATNGVTIIRDGRVPQNCIYLEVSAELVRKEKEVVHSS